MRRAASLFLSIVLTAAPAVACSSDDGEWPMFACQTMDKHFNLKDESIAICGRTSDDQKGSTGLHYEHMVGDKVDFSYPADPAEGMAKLFFHHYFKGGLYHARVRFANGGYSYRIFFDDSPPATEPDTINGPSAGIEVRKGGKVISTLQCGERPASYFEDIRRGTTCDPDNPYGAKGCTEEPLELP
jgi:hypothetical protein